MKHLISLFVLLLLTSCQTDRFTLTPLPMKVPHIHNWNGTSTNWSGYAVPTTRNAASYVRGTWVVPTVAQSTSTHTYCSTWVGIDGYSSKTVEQIGTEQEWTADGPVYYAWFEMYPKFAYRINNFPVAAGDTITAEVSYVGNSNYLLTITNNTQDLTFSIKQKSGSATRRSVEWVAEAPYSGGVLPLANFGTVQFSDCYATVSGYTGPISSWTYDAITMQTSGGVIKAQPSSLSADGTSFSVTWNHE